MAVGGSRQVAYMAGGRPAAKTQMTVTLSGGLLTGLQHLSCGIALHAQHLWQPLLAR